MLQARCASPGGVVYTASLLVAAFVSVIITFTLTELVRTWKEVVP